MTEAASRWDKISDPAELLQTLVEAGEAPSQRKLGLAAMALVKRMGWLIHSSLTLKGLRLVELGAEGYVTTQEVSDFAEDVMENSALGVFHGSLDLALIVQRILWPTEGQSPVEATDQFAAEIRVRLGVGEGVPQTAILRDVFANPLSKVPFELRWRSADAVGPARGIYEDRAFDRLPMLADALMDAGCVDDQILGHCRSDGPHVRGCWVVDLVLGKE